MGWKFSESDFDDLIIQLKTDYTVLAPKRFVGRGRFSGTDLIRYAEIETLQDIVWDQKSTFSPKEVVFPITQTLFYFTEKSFLEPEVDEKQLLVFLRPCDINGVRRIDTIFLKNGPQADTYYADLRRRVRFVMIECTEDFDTCFCVSMKSNTASDYDMAVRLGRDAVLLEIKNDAFTKYVSPLVPHVDFTPTFIQENRIRVTVPEVDKMPTGIYTHEMWDEYKGRCIACGRCNTTCVTCTCHTTSDIFYDDNPLAGERRRTWAGCHIDGFTDMAGGIAFRRDNGSRMRFKVMHKVYDYKKRFGELMCVGCGRCDDNCPEYISYSGCIDKLSATVAEVMHAE